MRRGLIAALATAAMFAAVPAAAEPAPATPDSVVDHGWVPVPAEAFDRAAGVLCDFPIHSEPIVDEVRMRSNGPAREGQAQHFDHRYRSLSGRRLLT